LDLRLKSLNNAHRPLASVAGAMRVSAMVYFYPFETQEEISIKQTARLLL